MNFQRNMNKTKDTLYNSNTYEIRKKYLIKKNQEQQFINNQINQQTCKNEKKIRTSDRNKVSSVKELKKHKNTMNYHYSENLIQKIYMPKEISFTVSLPQKYIKTYVALSDKEEKNHCQDLSIYYKLKNSCHQAKEGLIKKIKDGSQKDNKKISPRNFIIDNIESSFAIRKESIGKGISIKGERKLSNKSNQKSRNFHKTDQNEQNKNSQSNRAIIDRLLVINKNIALSSSKHHTNNVIFQSKKNFPKNNHDLYFEKSRNNSYNSNSQVPKKYMPSFLVNSKKIQSKLYLIEKQKNIKEEKNKNTWFSTLEISEFDNNVSFHVPRDFIIKSTMQMHNENNEESVRIKNLNNKRNVEEKHLQNNPASGRKANNKISTLINPLNFSISSFIMQERKVGNLNLCLSKITDEIKPNSSLITKCDTNHSNNNSLIFSFLNLTINEHTLENDCKIIEQEINKIKKKIGRKKRNLKNVKMENKRLKCSINLIIINI